MDADWIRDLCLSFPGTTEHVQWGDNLVFKVAGKIHAVLILHPAAVWLSFKASPEKFFELTERPGVIPAPYLARAKWVALESRDVLTREELATLLRESYDMVVAKLTRKNREALAAGMSPKRKPANRKAKSAHASKKPRRKMKKPSR